MSGALSPIGTTLALGTPAAALSTLQHAAFRFVPFKVLAQATTVGRKTAIHDFPFADGVQTEDLGARARIYRFTGYLVGPAAPVLEKAILAAAETPGPGLLVHPTIGARNVVCLSLTTGSRFDRMRVIELHWEFLEPTEGTGLATAIATAVAVLATVASGWATSSRSFNRAAVPAAAVAPEAKAEAATVSAAFTERVVRATTDGTGALRAVAGLPGNHGRYAAGSLGALQPAATTAEALANATVARAAVVAAAAACTDVAENLGEDTDYVAALRVLMAKLAAALIDPTDRIRILLGLVSFAYESPTGSSTIGEAMAIVRGAVATAARQAAALALAEACAAFTPASHDDAVAVMLRVGAALDTEITAAGDALDDDTFTLLRRVRSDVIADLLARGADLALIEEVQFQAPMPALWVAHRLYQDALRVDELVNRANPVHPAFMPTTFSALAR